MSARIAPEPINTTISTASDYRSRSMSTDVAFQPDPHAAQEQPRREAATFGRFSDVLPPLPTPPDPPGTAFAAAVVAGALSPRPQSPQEIFLRLGTNWTPPESDLHLADRTA